MRTEALFYVIQEFIDIQFGPWKNSHGQANKNCGGWFICDVIARASNWICWLCKNKT